MQSTQRKHKDSTVTSEQKAESHFPADKIGFSKPKAESAFLADSIFQFPFVQSFESLFGPCILIHIVLLL